MKKKFGKRFFSLTQPWLLITFGLFFWLFVENGFAQQAQNDGGVVSHGSIDAMFGVHNVDKFNVTPETFKVLAEAGVNVARSNAAAWHRIEKQQGKFNWQAADYVVEQSVAVGMNVMFNLIGPPEWASAQPPGARGPAHLAMVKDLEQWGRYCRAVMERYKGRVTLWEIWNEENAPRTWFQGGTPEDYVSLVKTAYLIAKEIDPDNHIIMGGVVGPDVEKRQKAPDFFLNTLRAGVSRWVDVYSVHYTANQWGRYLWFRDMISRYGDIHKSMWNTEENYRGGPGGIGKAFIIDHYLQDMEKIIYFLVKDFRNSRGDLIREGLFDENGTKKPELAEYSTIASFLKNKFFSGAKYINGIYFFVFETAPSPKKISLVVWADSGTAELLFDQKPEYKLTKGSNPRSVQLSGDFAAGEFVDYLGNRLPGSWSAAGTLKNISVSTQPVYVNLQVEESKKFLSVFNLSMESLENVRSSLSGKIH